MINFEDIFPESIEKNEPITEENKSTQKNNPNTNSESLCNSTTEKTNDKIEESQNQIIKYFNKMIYYFFEYFFLNANYFIIKIKDIYSKEENFLLLYKNIFLKYINLKIINGIIIITIYKYNSAQCSWINKLYNLSKNLSNFKNINIENINSKLKKLINPENFHKKIEIPYLDFVKYGYGFIFYNLSENNNDIKNFYYNLKQFTFLFEIYKIYNFSFHSNLNKKKNIKLIKDKDKNSFSVEDNYNELFEDYEIKMENQHIKEISFFEEYIEFCYNLYLK